MIPITDPTFDFLVLELGFDTRCTRILVLLLIFGVLLECDTWYKDNVLAYSSRVASWTTGFALFKTEFIPCPAFSDARIDGAFYDGPT